MNGLSGLFGSKKGVLNMLAMALNTIIGLNYGVDPWQLMLLISGQAGVGVLAQGAVDMRTPLPTPPKGTTPTP